LNQIRFNRTAFLATGIALVAMWLWTPGDTLPLCGFRWLTGYPCPLCGLTRAMCQIVKGHWRAAMEYHALSPLVLGLLLMWPFPKFRPPWVHIAVLFLGYGIGRAFLRNSSMSFFN